MRGGGGISSRYNRLKQQIMSGLLLTDYGEQTTKSEFISSLLYPLFINETRTRALEIQPGKSITPPPPLPPFCLFQLVEEDKSSVVTEMEKLSVLCQQLQMGAKAPAQGKTATFQKVRVLQVKS